MAGDNTIGKPDTVENSNDAGKKRRSLRILPTYGDQKPATPNNEVFSSIQSTFDDFAWKTYVLACGKFGFKISVFGDDPIKQRIETELADKTRAQPDNSLNGLKIEYNTHLAHARDTISNIKEQIREIKKDNKEEGERLVREIKPSIERILEANQVINYAFHLQAFHRSDTDFIRDLFKPLDNRCKDLNNH